MTDSTEAPPFDGLKVIDCASFVAGPAAATILSDFGAEVIKIEPLEGDPYRTLLPGETYPWELDSRNKQSVAIDLKHPEGLAVLYRLVRQADVFVTNFPLGARKRLRIDHDTLAPVNPRLIYASLTAYGETGPEAEKTGFDSTAYWARSGLMDLVKPEHSSPPSRSVIAMGDHPTAVALYAAIATALYRRERTGRGGLVSSSLIANGLWANSVLTQAALAGISIPDRQPRTHNPNPLSNVYRCRDDRWLNLAVLNDRQYPVLCRLLGHEALIDDPRYVSQAARHANNIALIAVFDEAFLTRKRDEWCQLFERDGITHAPISTVHDLPHDAQLLASGVIVPFADGSGMTVSSPIGLGAAARVAPVPAPTKVGQHTEAVLLGSGYSIEEIASLRRLGVLAG